MDTLYRLPNWLGGHEVEIVVDHDNGDYTVKTVDELAGARQRLRVTREVLIEVKPPSIDDPVSLPLNIFCSENDGSLHLETEAGRTFLWVRVRGEHIKHAGGVFDYSDSTLDLQVADLRDLARAAWQRANAIEAQS